MAKESFRERQEAELEVLKSIFDEDVNDLRPAEGKWSPLELKIALTPLKGSSGHNKDATTTYVKTHLHIKCGPKYPRTAPKILLEDSKGLTEAQIAALNKQLHDHADTLKGEVMIFELTQMVQAFLHQNNKPPVVTLSFYEQMKRDNLKRESQKTFEKEKERQVLIDQVSRIKEQLKNEPRRRKDTARRSVSESSSKRRSSSSETSEITSPNFKTATSRKECNEHRRSDTLYFTNVGRKIQRGGCLGHSAKGCVFYSGIDLESGQLVYITEWNVKYIDLEAKCLPNCSPNRSLGDQRCTGHTPDDFIGYVEKQVAGLANLQHKNLLGYQCVLGLKKKDGILIYLVQDFLLGTSISGISSSIGWSSDGTSMVAKGIVDALIYLHNNGVSHSWLYDTSVFMDNNGRIRVGDFGILSFLQELVGGSKTFTSDLLALGALIESLSINISSEMKDFIELCRSDRTLSASDLLDHPFLCPVVLDTKPSKAPALLSIAVQPTDRPAATTLQTPITSNASRIANEFQILTYLGRGAYGDVLKCRNILDNRQYAIKRIPLPARSRQLYRKMTREVELLSRLNHENVVRYFTSWIEIGKHTDDKFDKQINECGSEEYSMSVEPAKQHSNRILLQEASSSDSSSDDDWIVNCPPHRRISSGGSSDCIEFVNSDGEVQRYDDDENEATEETKRGPSPRNPTQYMYIQMEFCEKSTLRTAIDSGLHENQERVWRLFREIAEGLAHIHQQGMIHRDLKPVNIFLDSRDQVKIGDFGLATTGHLALQSQDNNVTMPPAELGTSSQTGKVGTALYVAPELCGSASKSTYNQKVDLYSLGIIMFEMCSPPPNTAMERVSKILALRTPKITFPDDFLLPKHSQQAQVIRWLLNHDPAQRPTSEELLLSELVPPAKLEASELEDMIRLVLANPQTRTYKHLVARCLTQESSPVCELTYHMGMVPILASFEFVKTKIMSLFHKHGAIEVEAPLLTPYNLTRHNTNVVKLMTHSGSVVTLPHDLRLPFVRHAAINGLNNIRRYSISRVYREKKVFNFHPKQLYEIVFDVITPTRGNLLIDAELLTIAHELVHSELSALTRQNQNIRFRINHTSLLRAILLYCNVPPDKWKELLSLVADFMENKISKFQLTASINNSFLQNTKHNTTTLLEFLQIDSPITNINLTPLRVLIRGRGEPASLAQTAIRELETVIQLVQGMLALNGAAVVCQIHIVCGLSIGFDRAKTGGVVWQMVGNLKPDRQSDSVTTIAVGGRYDSLLADIQKTAQNSGLAINQIVNREISGAGFSFALDKLVYALGGGGSKEYQSIEVVVCVCGSRPPLKDVTQILRALWNIGIRTSIIEAINEEETLDLAKDCGASHIILLGEGGVLRVRTWTLDRFQEKYVTRPELISYIQTKLRPPETSVVESYHHVQALQTSASQNAIASMKNMPGAVGGSAVLQLLFLTAEKLTANKRKRYENQISQNLTSSLNKFVKKEKLVVVVCDLSKEVVKAIVGMDPRDDDSYSELQTVIEKFPKQKKYISEIYDEITETLSEAKAPPIVGLYSIPDNYYRLIL